MKHAGNIFAAAIWLGLLWSNRKSIIRKCRYLYRRAWGLMEDDNFPMLHVQNLIFSDGTALNVSGDDIIVFVGPNNSGKSASLKEIKNFIVWGASRPRHVLKDIKVSSPQTSQEIVRWIQTNTKKDSTGGRQMPFVGRFNDHNFENDWEYKDKRGLREIGDFLTLHLSTEERLQLASPVASIEFASEVETHPLHKIYIDEDFEAQVDEHFFRNFKEHIVVNRSAGPKVRLHVGEAITHNSGLKRRELILATDALPALHEQGDGMRAFVGVLINILAARRRVILLDEPEAFLHPPQAAALGKLLAQNLPKERQLFVATHSSDFLKGLLENNHAKVRVVRLERDGEINKAHELDPANVRSVWSDPLLRYSGILDGLFHNGVVVCEGDTDCRFYSAVIENTAALDIHTDLIFVHGGGKGKIASIISALRAVGVPVKAIADFDVLADESVMKKIVESLGGSWEGLRPSWKITKDAVDRVRAASSVEDIREQVGKVFDSVRGHNLSENAIEDIRRIIRQGSGWAEAKRVGKSYIGSGDHFKCYEKLESELRSIGLFVVPVGEVEGFYKSVGGKGPKWVLEILELDLSSDPRLEEARKYTTELLGDWIITPAASL